MERRDFLGGMGSAAGFGLGLAALAERAAFAANSTSGDPAEKLAKTASECVSVGQACTQHCIDMLAAGNTSMGDCAKATYEMTAACETLSRMARANSKHLPAMAKIAADLCKSCETECRKHAKSMEICKTCADSCASCYEQCKALGA